MRSDIKLFTKIKWIFRKGEVKALRPEMESLKSSLQLLIHCIMLEEMQQEEMADETREEM